LENGLATGIGSLKPRPNIQLPRIELGSRVLAPRCHDHQAQGLRLNSNRDRLFTIGQTDDGSASVVDGYAQSLADQPGLDAFTVNEEAAQHPFALIG